ncbi:MAG: sugar transferase [Spirochaetes bacterium]|nr:sugar transferase [Spirochaetota bacterium]
MYTFLKRCMDLFLSGVGVFVLSLLFAVITLVVWCDSGRPVFFRQERVGKNGRPFLIYKFRTMVKNAQELGPGLSKSQDTRITRTGRFLRKYKLDELPQLFNVLKGEMSLVGPRPEVPRYVERFKREYETILKVKPGITDYASLRFRNEGELLNTSEDIENCYIEQILPQKMEYYRRYIENRTVWRDLGIIVRTVCSVFAPYRDGLRSGDR